MLRITKACTRGRASKCCLSLRPVQGVWPEMLRITKAGTRGRAGPVRIQIDPSPP